MDDGSVSPAAEAKVGEALPPLDIPLTRSFIVATAIASRDYQPVHHDPDHARVRGSSDIVMNILTTQGLVARFVTDWTGPNAVLRRVAIRLGAPNYPGDTMRLTGTVSSRRRVDEGSLLTVSIVGRNGLGDHVTGDVDIVVPVAGGDR